MLLNLQPVGGGQDQNGQLSSGEALLMAQVFVRSDKHLISSFGRLEQVTVLQVRPSQFIGGGDRVEAERVPQRSRRALIE